MAEVRCDVLVVGGSLGGCAAALRAGEMGASVVLIEESEWIGGQLTSQGVCTPDENRWIEKAGGTRSYRELRERARDHYRNGHRLSDAGRAQTHLNVGSCWVSRMAVEPKVARHLLANLLAAQPNVDVQLRTRVLDVETRINAVHAVNTAAEDGAHIRYVPAFVLDATELGDLLPLAGVEHVVGAESREETGEPDAPEQARPDWLQPFTFPFALELRPTGEDHTIEPPEDYTELKAIQRYHIVDGAMRGMFDELGWWTYRRVIDAANFSDAAYPNDVAMINTASNDFRGGVIPSGDSFADAEILARARRASLGYVYWLQTECPRVDGSGRIGYPEMKLRADWFDTVDGIAPHPYIRESRRIRSLQTVREHDIVAADAGGNPCQIGPRAAHLPDSVGIGHYWLDIHDGGTDEPSRFLETRPFQIPLGALVPVRMTNLLPACKNLGVTHLTNGAYRLHPIEWNIGESAGALAAHCARHGLIPRAILSDTRLLRRFQRELLVAGIPIYWWTDLPAGHSRFVAAQALAVEGMWPHDDTLEFRPDEPLDQETVDRFPAESARIARRGVGRTRGEAAEEILAGLFPDDWK